MVHKLASLSEKPFFAPKVVSIEDFAEEVSGLQSIDSISALFEFYAVYKKNTPAEKTENWETFSAWAQTLLYDFNEIDRYLIDYKSFFGYLSDIQEMNHWYLMEEKTPLMENYLSFWRKLPEYYEQLRDELEDKTFAYQGMVYRKAAERVEAYLEEHKNPHVFLGFNALNNAEQEILQKMLSAGVAEVFWDIDEVFFRDNQHDASLFMRDYVENWQHFKEHEFRTVSNTFSGPKNIETIGVPKNIGQAKYVGEILSKLPAEELKDTAVVLGDEGLLIPVLNSLPSNVQEVNVTMGFPLKNAPVTFLLEHLLTMQANPQESWYYKDVVTILNHPLIQKVSKGSSKKVSERIKKENLIYLSLELLLQETTGALKSLVEICFGDWKNAPAKAIERLQELIFHLKAALHQEEDKLTLEFLYQHNVMFNKLGGLLQTYPHLSSVKSLLVLFRDLVSTQTVDFRGKPFTGLQLMGMLESRVLDFKNVIVTSVNEGVLPAGKSSNSFIPYDLKQAYNLPTYKEKDAVYSYHFHHLLQRAQNAFLLYNTESDGLNAGEKSRFLLQLQMERQEAHVVRDITIAPKVPAVSQSLQVVEKSPQVLEKIKELAGRGFSSSALTTYMRNPLDFYRQYVLGIKEREEVEETIAYNTLGTVVHDTLETFYKQWEGKEVTKELLKEVMKQAPAEVGAQFRKTYTKDPLSQGQNLLIFEVAKRYVINFLNQEIKDLEAGNTLRIVQVETDLKTEIPIEELGFPVFIRGKVDRVDERNGTLRIIDYKTGKVQQNQVEVVDWDKLASDYDKYGKTFQILTYATMLDSQKSITGPAEAGIISFKNLQAGFLKFSKKDKNGRGAEKSPQIDKEVLENYKEQLKKLILEICDSEIPFQEKEIISKSW